MVVKAPSIPVPKKILTSLLISSDDKDERITPSNKDPIAFTANVAFGVPIHSLTANLNVAPRAPPTPTRIYGFINQPQPLSSINHTQVLATIGHIMTIWFVTGNSGKVAEAKEFFSQHDIRVEQLKIESVEPQAKDLETVAISKINQAVPHLPNANDMILVEDAGLFVAALDGFPGVYSSYALETIGNHGILKLIDHLKSEDIVTDANLRKAEFRAVAVLYRDGEIIVGKGACPGRISHDICDGEGFGFDPIFIPADLDIEGNPVAIGEIGHTSTHGKQFGVISLGEKQLYSHRMRALSSLISQLDFLG